MKIILSYLSIFCVWLLPASAQFADPYISISMRPPQVPIGATTTLEVLQGNFGSTAVCVNSFITTVSVGPNAEILGIASNSDTRWVQATLSAGPGNTIQLTNANGGFSTFDLSYVYLTVRAVAYGGPNNCGANITYIIANNPCAGGAPNAIHGNLEVTNDNSVSSLTVPVLNTLPLQFTDFSTKDNGCTGSILWETAQEENVSHFDVQQSFDGITYNTVKTVPSKGNGGYNYEAEVKQSQRNMYYRVVASDIDGKKIYGTVQTLQLNDCIKATLVRVFPMPAARNQEINIQSNVNDKINYRLVDMSGKVIKTGTFVRSTKITALNSGTYLLEITSNNTRETQTILIQ
jgi:hypothetical protein